jgi:type I restriction-modification system DNA methylase subunit
VELILENLFGKYSFGMESGISPDILGYIFEKTINFISGTGTNQQKMQGAYYTPDDVVEFIIEKTLTPIIFRKMIVGLKESGWSDTDLKGYDSLEDILRAENMPRNPKHIRKMIDSIDNVRVLDPACGSGHFLTAMLASILRVKESLLRAIGENVDRYRLKRDIISNNLFGVDIDQNAVEIARLRLWLSLIEEVADPEHIETLPNIDFNIIAGNALIGWLNESLQKHPLMNLLEDSYVKETLDNLEVSYKDSVG